MYSTDLLWKEKTGKMKENVVWKLHTLNDFPIQLFIYDWNVECVKLLMLFVMCLKADVILQDSIDIRLRDLQEAHRSFGPKSQHFLLGERAHLPVSTVWSEWSTQTGTHSSIQWANAFKDAYLASLDSPTLACSWQLTMLTECSVSEDPRVQPRLHWYLSEIAHSCPGPLLTISSVQCSELHLDEYTILQNVIYTISETTD